ncbi:diaminopimelate decarboxylase [Methanobrevibacter arboriphilus JCM 13429 = DSM 1125]|uniref:Diaminopimelate decarboxylase n=1 Tax=Methanobrevibacter arboriphilus JCM 13429 = DSM 1125 TaxID=1300164 RepID=A0A1V6N4A9_METAZ|nr:diaminopimelate decarboxylase [Methanobrevibacter arboriphilus]OQD59462.1 diaminopimelate decarboxylase [Methanobrevibacter arboriphilus JCM 13429 = DSM 1125]
MDLNLKINDKGHVDIGGADATKLAEEYGTPLYVIDEDRIRDNYKRVFNAFTKYYPDFKILYACKANTNLSVMRILEEEGSCIDAVSPGEVFTSLKTGFSPDRILFTGNNVTNDELRYIDETGVRINLDSVSQLKRLAEIVDPEGYKISFRVNPMVGAGHHEHCITGGEMSKFGIKESEAVEVYKLAKSMGFEPVGMHTHIGSGILDPEPFKLATTVLMDIAGKVSQEANIGFEFLDLGGGLGIPYEPEENLLDIDPFAEEITGIFKSKLSEYGMDGANKPSMYIEPGRYLVGDASVLLTRVNTVKNSYRKFIGVDSGFNTLLRPAMYGSYHHIVVANKANKTDEISENETKLEKVDVAGNVCESGDLFARDRPLPIIEEGDLLSIMNAGAYSFSMASQYNSRPRPAEILVKDGKSEIIRERETYDDLFKNQIIPKRLEN